MMAVLSGTPLLYIGGCLLLGLAVGSFLNVVIYRLPIILERQWRDQATELVPTALGQTAVQITEGDGRFTLRVPRSACPVCKAPIRAWQNIPIVSWLLLRGRCAACNTKIS